MLEKSQPLDLEKFVEDIRNMVDYWNVMRNEGVIAIKRKVIDHIKSACEFYLNNKIDCDSDQFGLLDVLDDCIKLGLDKKDKKWFDNFYKRVKELCKDSSFDVSDLIDDYNEWLFRLAFKDVLEEKE